MKYRITLKKLLLYTNKLLRHKFWTFYFCCKYGIIWRGIIHDLSKFLPSEFIEGVRYYTPGRSSYEVCQEVNGYSKAYVKHINRNPHHSLHWGYPKFDGTIVHTCMPYKDTLEMFCNYLATGRVYYGKKELYEKENEWWQSQTERRSHMHPIQGMFLDICFSALTSNEEVNKSRLKCLYNTVSYMYNSGLLNESRHHRKRYHKPITPVNTITKEEG